MPFDSLLIDSHPHSPAPPAADGNASCPRTRSQHPQIARRRRWWKPLLWDGDSGANSSDVLLLLWIFFSGAVVESETRPY